MYWNILDKEERRGTNKYLLCRCICGKEKYVRESSLKNKKSTSCGCTTQSTRKIKHGRTRSPEYRSWEAMKNRCLNTKASNYNRYGGRGITVYNNWLEFSIFLKDMGLRPKGTTLGRVDNSGNYSPDNCAWQTKKEQLQDKEDVILNFELAMKIRKELKEGKKGIDVALKYNVSSSTISVIKNNKLWV